MTKITRPLTEVLCAICMFGGRVECRGGFLLGTVRYNTISVPLRKRECMAGPHLCLFVYEGCVLASYLSCGKRGEGKLIGSIPDARQTETGWEDVQTHGSVETCVNADPDPGSRVN
jgi:hypothetical protein